jgi:hypothetical protein
MGWEHELAHSAGGHTCRSPDCMNLVPLLLTWHSTLYNQHPLHKTATCHDKLLGEGWARKPAEDQTFAAAFIEAHSFRLTPRLPVLPLCTEALGITVSF